MCGSHYLFSENWSEELTCPVSDSLAIIEYNEDEKFYSLSFENQFYFSFNTFLKIDFDELNNFGRYILIPM